MTKAAEWHGVVGDSWAAEWRRTDRSFRELATSLDAAILAHAADGPGQALDIGCGAGATSLALGRARPDLTVTGIDVSAELVAVAQDRAAAAGLDNVDFAVADLNDRLPRLPLADLLVSRHGVMFADDPAAMFRSLHGLARSGAALVFSCFRTVADNSWAGALAQTVTGKPIVPTISYAPGPFGFADPAFVARLLAATGWRAVRYEPVDYAYVAGEGPDPVGDAAAFFGRIGPVAAALRTASAGGDMLHARLAAALARHRIDDRVVFPAGAWLWSAQA